MGQSDGRGSAPFRTASRPVRSADSRPRRRGGRHRRVELARGHHLRPHGEAQRDATRRDGGLCRVQSRLEIALCSTGKRPPDPALLPENSGWEWPLGEGRDIKVIARAGGQKLYFEQNRKNRIRAFFLGEETANGTEKLRITVTLPQGTDRKPTEEEEYGPVSTGLDSPTPSPYGISPVDSEHAQPSTRAHGFLRTSGERLVFEDGTPARFWGIDVMAFALFSNNGEIERHAKRLSMLGFNLVRLHHHDTMGWVDPDCDQQARPWLAHARRAGHRPRRLLDQVPERERHLRLARHALLPHVPRGRPFDRTRRSQPPSTISTTTSGPSTRSKATASTIPCCKS